MATAAEMATMTRLAALRAGSVGVENESEKSATSAASGAMRKAVRRRLIAYGIHAVVGLGAPESLGMTVLIGFLVDMARLALTLLGPVVGIKGAWTELFVIKFFNGDLLDKGDAALILFECLAAIMVAVGIVVTVGLVGYQATHSPVFDVFSSFFL